MEFKHTPVLLNEVIDGLKINPHGIYLDCTIGGAGHSSEIVKQLAPDGVLIGFDKDSDAIATSLKKLSGLANVYHCEYDETSKTMCANFYDTPSVCTSDILEKQPSTPSLFDLKKIKFISDSISINCANKTAPLLKDKPTCLIIKADFKQAPKILNDVNIPLLSGALIDLGISSYQLDNAERGFSFKAEAVLDMRMDVSQQLTAKEIVNTYSEEELTSLFFKYGEEEFSKSIARNIVKNRANNMIETTTQLNNIIENSMPKKIVFSRGGASKKVFQAIRIEVNSELLGLNTLLKQLVDILAQNGRLCVISFHSLEDRIVKNIFKDLSIACICPPNFPKCICNHKAQLKLISRKPIIATEQELGINSRSSCAKLRIVEKI